MLKQACPQFLSVSVNMGYGKSKGLSRKSQKAKTDQRYHERKRNFMDLTPSQDELPQAVSEAQLEQQESEVGHHLAVGDAEMFAAMSTPSQPVPADQVDPTVCTTGKTQAMVAALDETLSLPTDHGQATGSPFTGFPSRNGPSVKEGFDDSIDLWIKMRFSL